MLEFIIGYSMAQQSQARMSSLARSMEAAQGGRSSERVEQIDAKVENLGLIIKALWSLLEDQGMTADQLMDRIEQIQAEIEADMTDDIPNAVPCPSCQSMVSRGMPKCQICGAEVPNNQPHPLDI